MSRIKFVIVVGTSAALIAACSSSGNGTSSDSASPPAGKTTVPLTSSAPIASAATTPASSAASSAPPVSASDLSGTWNGRYSGAFSGTFVLKWTQSGSKLTGTITLSTAPGALPIDGTVSGGHIQFGTVGSTAITYTGSASKSSMSGSYKVGGSAAGTGSWTATKA